MPRIARPTLCSAVLAMAVATPALAQQSPTPAPTPAPTAAPSPIVQPIPGVTPAPSPAPMPRLNPDQARELARLIEERRVLQGLRYQPLPAASTAAQARPAAAEGTGRADSRLAQRLTGQPDTAAIVRDALDYARAVHSGRLDESDFQSDWGLRPAPYDPLPAFARAVEQNRIAQWIQSLPPPYAGYDGLRDGLARYREIEAQGGWRPLTGSDTLEEGATGAAVQALRTRLAVEDSQVVATGTSFDAELTAAVKRAQARYGITQDGRVGPGTRRVLNVPVADRIRQIMANMERWRWLPPELPRDRIQVNIAAALLTVFRGDEPIGSMRAVTGAPGHETPMLQSTIHSVVLNPPWNVPQSIANAELWPKQRRDPGYFARNQIRVIDLGNGNSRLQQAAGDMSALGRYKFDFDNPYAVYLHDTPVQAAFQRDDRLASHGCVRLARPAALARLLLESNPEWQPEAIAETIASGETTRAQLADPVAVYLLYWTAYATPEGGMVFLDDPYGWDATLAAKIEARSAQRLAAN